MPTRVPPELLKTTPKGSPAPPNHAPPPHVILLRQRRAASSTERENLEPTEALPAKAMPKEILSKARPSNLHLLASSKSEGHAKSVNPTALLRPKASLPTIPFKRKLEELEEAYERSLKSLKSLKKREEEEAYEEISSEWEEGAWPEEEQPEEGQSAWDGWPVTKEEEGQTPEEAGLVGFKLVGQTQEPLAAFVAASRARLEKLMPLCLQPGRR